jgi:formiminotetrahydrofolate cyclodeaminase
MYGHKSLKRYLDDLSARLPAPGGGSAAALVAAVGCALISMVCQFTLGKDRYRDYQAEVKKILARANRLEEKLLELVDLDVLAYKSKDIKKALGVPVEICRISWQAIKLCPELARKGNRLLASDVAIAAVFLEAGFKSGYYNIAVNLKSLNKCRIKKKIETQIAPLEKEVVKIRKETEVKIGKIITRQNYC